MAMMNLYALTNYSLVLKSIVQEPLEISGVNTDSFMHYFELDNVYAILIIALVLFVQMRMYAIDYDRRMAVLEDEMRNELEHRIHTIQDILRKESDLRTQVLETLPALFREIASIEAAKIAVVVAASAAGAGAPLTAMTTRARWATGVLTAFVESAEYEYMEIKQLASAAAKACKGGIY
jgi:hypothetical protein